MIPNLQDLPAPQEEESRFKKMIRPALALLVLLCFLGGVIWVYTVGIKQAADEDTAYISGLQGVGADLWLNGSAPEVQMLDPDLITELARLRKLSGLSPQIVVVSAGSGPGTPAASHEIIYMQGKRAILILSVFLDPEAKRVDVLAYKTTPEFLDSASGP